MDWVRSQRILLILYERESQGSDILWLGRCCDLRGSGGGKNRSKWQHQLASAGSEGQAESLRVKTTSCLSPSFPNGVNTFHSASLQRPYVTLAVGKPSATPKKKSYVASSTRRTSGIGPAPLALGGQILVAFCNALSPPFRPTRPSNVPGFSTSATPDGRGTLSWSENLNVCARRWRNSKLWTPVHSRRQTGRRIPGREVW
jgi:hypothetical protein